MPVRILTRYWRQPTAPRSLAIFILMVAGMAWLRLGIFPDQLISLSYGVPLLICLFYPDRRLLWAMAGAFVALSAYKSFVALESPPDSFSPIAMAWGMQVFNTVAVTLAVHMIINLLEALQDANRRLDRSNQELITRDEEISRQNEELHAQTEELAQQNEEIQQQTEELRMQTEELGAANAELAKRETILEALLQSLDGDDGHGGIPEKMCQPLLGLFPNVAVAIAMWEKRGDALHLVAQHGLPAAFATRHAVNASFAGIVMTEKRSAFVEDLRLRPDLFDERLQAHPLRSVLATPLRVNHEAIGAVEIYAAQPQTWTTHQFRLLEWATAHCGLLVEVRRLQQELRQNNADLDRLVQARTAELQDMVNELEHFSYSITHDLRAPLRAMHGFAGMLAEECAEQLTEQSRDYLRRLTTAATRMDRLITDALVYSKTVREELALRPVNPAELLRGMIESYPAFQPPHANIELQPELPRVLANEAALTQCFSNLLGNAVKFVPKGTVPSVRVRADHDDGMVRLWFEDNGIGIPPEMQSRVFLMFQRASKEFEGTGIGLALVRKVAERMGGRVGVLSEPGRGSRFWVDLKRA